MAFAITQNCCADATCVTVCPVNCIHPTPDEPDFGTTDMLYVDPRSCINCGACADACPVDAVLPISSLTGPDRVYAEINASWFDTVTPGPAPQPTPAPRADRPTFHDWGRPQFDRTLPARFPALRVAVVGSGPAGMYAVEDLLLHTDAQITVFERLHQPDGLVRFGVAPDHPATKQVADTFARLRRHPRVTMRYGVEVGRDLTHESLAATHDAVIHAVGAAADRRLDLAGEDLTGSVSATRFVAWYNGHPDVPGDAFRLDSERVVVVGNGNVALDVARILVSDPDALAETTVARHALAELRRSKVREVVVLGRRGPEHAACTVPELLALTHLPTASLVIDDHDPRIAAALDAPGPRDCTAVLHDVAREAVDWSRPPAPGRRIVLRFHSTPSVIDGDGVVQAIRVRNGDRGTDTTIPAGTVLSAIGCRGIAQPGLPFDEESGTVPHEAGRVHGVPGAYVVGWIKRGPSGGIGTNRRCAAETVGTLLDDVATGVLPVARPSSRRLSRRRAALS